MPLELQPKLLRVLQDGEFMKVGATKTNYTNARVIAASPIDLEEAVSNKRLLEPLMYRLSVFSIYLPPLRGRGNDKIELAEYYLDLYSRKHNRILGGLEESAKEVVMSYNWPGNVRELQRTIERAVIQHGVKPQGETPRTLRPKPLLAKQLLDAFEA